MSNRTVGEAIALCIATHTPVLLWGDPGTGKTSMVRDLVRTIRAQRGLRPDQFGFETVIASIHEPSDFGGLPVVNGDETRFVPPAWAKRLARAGAGLAFFDEISTASPATQAALLRVVLEGAVGDLQLPPEVVFMAAANPPETAANGWEMSAPLANRFVHLDWRPEVQEVSAGLMSGFAPVELPVLPEDRSFSVALAGAVVGYINSRPGSMLAVPNDAAAASRGWPSPRAWETVIKLVCAARTCGASREAEALLLVGTVGPGVAHELTQYLDTLDLPDPEEILKNPASFVLPGRGDHRYAVLAAIAGAVTANPTPDRWLAGWEVLKIAADGGALDVAAVAARSLTACSPKGVRAPSTVAAFLPVMREAGVLADMALPAQR